MKILTKIHNLIRENEKGVKISQKHDANLQKNSTLYFQIGLIVCLLMSYFVLEMNFLNEPIKVSDETALVMDDDYEFVMDDFTIYVDKPVEQKQTIEEPKPQAPDELDVVDNNFTKDESFNKVFGEDPKPKTDLNSKNFPVEPIIDVGETVPFVAVEKVPIFPGCEKESTNLARKKCFETKMSNFISKKFNTDIASQYGLEGVQRVFVEFQIDKSGNITEIRARAPHPALEREAQKVINRLPQMTPGMQRDQPVSVKYLQPIVFKVR